MRPVNLAAYFTLIKAHLGSTECKRTHITRMSCCSWRICTGGKGLSRKDVTKLVRLQIVYKAFDYFSYRFDCFALLVKWSPDWQTLQRKKGIIAEGRFPCYASHYASSSSLDCIWRLWIFFIPNRLFWLGFGRKMSNKVN